MGECSESAGKVATGRVTLFSQTFHWAHKLELLHCHFWCCYNYSWNYHSIARKNWMLVTSVVLRFNINLKWDRKSSQSYNAYFFFFFEQFSHVISWNCYVTTHIVLIVIYYQKNYPFFQIGDWRVLADDNRISCFCCWWWTSESASKSHGARKTGGIFRTLVSF